MATKARKAVNKLREGDRGDVVMDADGGLTLDPSATIPAALADGDYGDIVASAGGTVLTIENKAVTLAKMADLAQDQVIMRTTAGAAGVPETATITAAARTVLDDATVGAMVDTLGGAASTGTGGLARKTGPTITDPALGNTNLTGLKHIVPNSMPTTSGTTGAVTVDWSASRVVKQAEPTGALVYTFTAPGVSNVHLQLLIESDGTSPAEGITWPAAVIWYGAAITTTTANKKMLVNFFWDGTSYHAMGASQV